MQFLSNIATGIGVALAPTNIFFCFLGALLGTLIGVLPGVGPTATIAMLLPITFSLEPDAALIMLAGIYYGAQYGSSSTAILINLPGEPSSAVTAIEGYQLARQGKAGPALAIAAIGSFFAGTIATLLICIAAKPLTALALEFGPAEYFSLIVLGLICSVTLAHGSLVKALAMVTLGMVIGSTGTDTYTGVDRFTFGIPELTDGVDVVAIAVGVFGIAEIFRNLENETARDVHSRKVKSLMPSWFELKMSIMPIIRGTGIGCLLGVLPGGGALLSSFASYAIEKRLSKSPDRFGNGALEGVAGPEAANNAGAQASFIPMLTLGIPSNTVMALMIGAMMIQGIAPGPGVITERPELFWGLIASMWVGNLMLVILNLPLVGLWVRLLTIPYFVLFPTIIIFSAIGAYSINSNVVDLVTISIFGIIGYLMYKLGFEPAPLLLGFILGPMAEEHFRRAMILSRGDPTIFLASPISAGFLIMSAVALIFVSLPAISRKREEVFAESED